MMTDSSSNSVDEFFFLTAIAVSLKLSNKGKQKKNKNYQKFKSRSQQSLSDFSVNLFVDLSRVCFPSMEIGKSTTLTSALLKVICPERAFHPQKYILNSAICNSKSLCKGGVSDTSSLS